jgi:hypothetical protein
MKTRIGRSEIVKPSLERALLTVAVSKLHFLLTNKVLYPQSNRQGRHPDPHHEPNPERELKFRFSEHDAKMRVLIRVVAVATILALCMYFAILLLGLDVHFHW